MCSKSCRGHNSVEIQEGDRRRRRLEAKIHLVVLTEIESKMQKREISLDLQHVYMEPVVGWLSSSGRMLGGAIVFAVHYWAECPVTGGAV